MSELKAGDFVTQAVKLVRPLAEGGMGRVWVAEHLGLHCEVVVKLMSAEMAARPDGAERFAREAAIAAAIKSPHAVQIFDHGVTAEGTPYIVMELLDGEDLGARLAARGRLTPAEVIPIVVQVSKALAKAHKAGIVHRDIKPDNIFLCETDAADAPLVKLLDFGTAKQEKPSHARTTVPGQIMGTPYYMSPEQSVGAPEVDERSDIWSLGIVVFEALTGQKPFDGASVGAITIAIHGALPKIVDLAPELPPSIDLWLERACAQLPEDRFATARDAAHGLIEALGGTVPSDQPTESVFFPPVKAKSGSTPVRPVTRAIEPLSASLPARGGERRMTTIAAGVVMAVAAVAMFAIVLHRAPAVEPTSVVTSNAATAKAPAPTPPPPPAPELQPAPEPQPAPEAKAPVAVAASPAKSEPKVLTKAPTNHAHAAKLGARSAKPAIVAKDAGMDDDLVRLTNAAAKHTDPAPAEAPPPPPASSGALPALP